MFHGKQWNANARPNRGRLVHVAHQGQAAAGRQGTKQVVHEQHIDHACLVHHEQIAVERVGFVAREHPGGGVDFEQPVDGLGLHAGRFGQALGGAARGGAQRAADLFSAEDEQVDEKIVLPKPT